MLRGTLSHCGRSTWNPLYIQTLATHFHSFFSLLLRKVLLHNSYACSLTRHCEFSESITAAGFGFLWLLVLYNIRTSVQSGLSKYSASAYELNGRIMPTSPPSVGRNPSDDRWLMLLRQQPTRCFQSGNHGASGSAATLHIDSCIDHRTNPIKVDKVKTFPML